MDPQNPVRGGLDAPAHEHDQPPVNFQAGDPARVGASAGVEVRRIAVDGVNRAMGVPADEGEVLIRHPAGQDFFDFAALLDVLGGAGGVVDAEELEGTPQPADEKLHEVFEVDFPKVRLMPVQDKKFAAGFCMAKDQSFVDFDTGEKGETLAGGVIGGPVKVAGDDAGVGAGDVMVAEDQVKPPFLVKAFQQVEDAVMGFADVGEVTVFKEFVPIADFDVGVTLGVVVLQGVVKQNFVGNKVVRPRAIAPVGIAEEDEAGVVVEGDERGGLENFGEVVGSIHMDLIGFFLWYQTGVIGMLTGRFGT